MSESTLESIAQEALKKIIFKVVADIIISRLVAMIPFLALPFISPFVALIVTKFLGMFYDELARVVSFKIIDIKTEKQRAEYDAAVADLKSALASKDQEEIERAKQNAIDRARELIRG